MNIKEYIENIAKFKHRRKKLNPSRTEILSYFSYQSKMSVMNVFHELNNTRFRLSYKNIHKAIQNFLNWNLIQYEGNTVHNERFYRLTSQGIYILLRSLSSGNLLLFQKPKGIFENYADDEIFGLWVYPYISRLTVANLEQTEIHQDLLIYLHNCCVDIDGYLNYLEIDKIKKGYNDKFFVKIGMNSEISIYSILISPFWQINKNFDKRDLAILAWDENFMEFYGRSQRQLSDNYNILQSIHNGKKGGSNFFKL